MSKHSANSLFAEQNGKAYIETMKQTGISGLDGLYGVFKTVNGAHHQLAENCTKEDAALFAASPDLLEVCRAVFELSKPMCSLSPNEVMEKLQTAIAKAEGR